MNDEHISQFAAEKLALFLKEEMVPELLAKWQAHYRDCPQCREYVDRSTKNQALAAQGEIAGQRLDRQLQKKLAAFMPFDADIGRRLWDSLATRRAEMNYLKEWVAVHYRELIAFPLGKSGCCYSVPGRRKLYHNGYSNRFAGSNGPIQRKITAGMLDIFLLDRYDVGTSFAADL